MFVDSQNVYDFIERCLLIQKMSEILKINAWEMYQTILSGNFQEVSKGERQPISLIAYRISIVEIMHILQLCHPAALAIKVYK